MSYRKLVYISIGLSLIVLLGLTSLDQLETKREKLLNAQSSYKAALDQSQDNLEKKIRRLVKNGSILNNLKLHLNYSLKQSLEAELSPGQLDALLILDNQCNSIAKASLIDLDPRNICEQAQTKFKWLDSPNKPTFFIAKKLPKSSLIIIGVNVLNASWLASFPSLAKNIDHHNLAFGTPPFTGSEIIDQGKAPSGIFTASLFFKKKFDQIVGSSLISINSIATDILLPIAFIALLLLLVFFIFDTIKLRQRSFNINILHKWSKNPYISPNKISPNQEDLIYKIQENIAGFFEHQKEELEALKHNSIKANSEMSSLQIELETRQKELCQTHSHQILAKNLLQNADIVSAMIDNFSSDSRKLVDFLKAKVLKTNNELWQISLDWQNGIAKRGLRQHLRSLVEEDGKRPGKSLLEDKIATINELTQKLSQATLQALMTAQKLTKRKTDTADIISAWKCLAKDPSELATANRIIEWDKVSNWATLLAASKRRGILELKCADKESLAIPSYLPLAQALSMIYSLIEAILSVADSNENLRLNLTKKQRNGLPILIFSLYDSKAKLKTLELNSEQLSSLHKITKPHAIEEKILLSHTGGHHLALTGITPEL